MTPSPTPAFALGLLAAAPTGQGFGQTGGGRTEGVTVADVAELSAVVETVAPTAREVLLRGPEGVLVTVHVPPEVHDLAKLKPGDRVVVRDADAVAVRMAREGEGGAPLSMQAGSAVSGPGQPPFAAASDQIDTTVSIQAGCPARGAVTFIGPAGVPRTVVPQEPEMQEFARGLRPGDRVNVTYREAMAVSVEPAGR